jgi:small nuclear ribonucleoprotein (snRNP)-like protein
LTTLALSLLAATVVVQAVVIWYRGTHGLLATRRRRSVLITLKSGESFSGVLMASDAQALVLHQAQALGIGENRTNVAVDGEVVILRPDVAFIQLP